jgi:hypothetical protein
VAIGKQIIKLATVCVCVCVCVCVKKVFLVLQEL